MAEQNHVNNDSENTFLTNIHMLNVLYLHNLTQNLELIDELLEETQENKLSFTQESLEISRQLENINEHLSAQKSDNDTKKQKPTWEFKNCYLADRNGLPPPKNADVDLRKSLDIISINDVSGTRWTREEWTPMLKILESIVVKGRTQPSMKKKEILTNDLEEHMFMKPSKATKQKIEEILGLLHELNDEIEKIIETPTTLQDIEKLNPESEIDWLMVAARTGNKNSQQCKHLWINYLRPSINKKRWSENETDSLRALVEQHGKNAWDRVAFLLGTRRTGAQCLSQYQKEINYDPKIEWSSSEDARLIACVLEQRVGDNIPWNTIQTEFPRRTVTQLMIRFTRHLDPDLKWGRWSEQEDKMLLDAYAKYAPQWYKIARRIPGRTSVQCRDRYQNFLNPYLKFGSWSCEEDAKILKYLKVNGSANWINMAQELPNRSNKQIMVRCGLLLGVKTMSAIKHTLSQSLANLESELEFIYKNPPVKSKGTESVDKNHENIGEPCCSNLTKSTKDQDGDTREQQISESRNPSRSASQHEKFNESSTSVDALVDPDFTSFLSELPDLLSSRPPEISTPNRTLNLVENVEETQGPPEIEILEEEPEVMSATPSADISPRNSRNRPIFNIGTLDIAVLADLVAQLREKDDKRFVTRKKAFNIKRRKRGRRGIKRFSQPSKFIMRHGDCKILQFFKARTISDDFDSADPQSFNKLNSQSKPKKPAIDEPYVPLSTSKEKGTKRYLSWPGIPINLKYGRRHTKLYIDKYYEILAERANAKWLRLGDTANSSDSSLPYLESFLTKILWDRSVVDMPDDVKKRQNEMLTDDNSMTISISHNLAPEEEMAAIKHLPPSKQNLMAWRYLLATKPSLKSQTEHVGAAYSSLYIPPCPVKKIVAPDKFRKPSMFQSNSTPALESGGEPIGGDGVCIDPSTKRVLVPPGSILKAAYKISLKRKLAAPSPSETSSPTTAATIEQAASRILSIEPYPDIRGRKNEATVKIYPSRLNSCPKSPQPGPTTVSPEGSDKTANPFFRAVALAKEHQKSASERNLIKTNLVRLPVSLVDCLAAQPEVAVALPNFYPPLPGGRTEKIDINYPLEVARKSKEYKYLQRLVETLFLHPALLAQMPLNIIEDDSGTPPSTN